MEQPTRQPPVDDKSTTDVFGGFIMSDTRDGDLPLVEENGEVWLSAGAEPRPRDRRAEALALFVPGFLVLAVAAAFGIGMLSWSGGGTDSVKLEQAAKRNSLTEPVAGRGMSPSATPSAGKAAPVATPTTTSDAPLPVIVLDGSADTVLGETVATLLRGKGWTVLSVASYDGSTNRTTVFYPKGRREEARKVALAMPGEQRLRVAPGGQFEAGAVNVVVAGDYQS